MNLLLTINNSFFAFRAAATGPDPFKANPLITLATLNRIKIVAHTEEGQELYRVEEQDNIFHIYRYGRNFLGFSTFKKLARARNRDNALKIIYMLTPAEIIHLEVSPVEYPEKAVV